MVRMTDIWDRTTEVLRGRASMLTAIAALLVFVPTVIQAGAQLYATGDVTSATGAAGAVASIGLLGLLLLVVRLWGNAAIVAAGSDPAYDRRAAVAQGLRRLGPAIGVTVLLGVAAVLLLLPFVALGGANVGLLVFGDFSTVPLPARLYLLIVALAVTFVAVRLVLLVPVIVNERLGVGAIGRAWRLTRGLFWRVFGVLLLFGVVFLVSIGAATLLLGLLARLLLGAEHVGAATFVGRIGAGAVTSAYAVVTGVFTAQLYRTLTGREAAETFA